MSNLLICGGRIIDPAQGIDRVGDLLLRDGKVAACESWGNSAEDGETIDARGFVVCPGFIDLHCHLRQPGYEEKETIATGTGAAARGGFTTLCCMPNTNPPIDNPDTILYVNSVASKEGTIRVLPIACITRGQKGLEVIDMTALASAGAVAFSDDGRPVLDSSVMRRALGIARELGLRVIDHCEDTRLSAGGHMNDGELSHRLGIGGMPAAAEESIVARDIVLAQETGAHVHIAHVSTAGSVELIRQAKRKGVNITCEATPHHLTLTEEKVITRGTNAKVNPPLRTPRDLKALVQGLRDGVIDAIATDHAPHNRKDKAVPFTQAAFGISGLETALGAVLSLVHDASLTLNQLVAALTANPARIIKRPELGSLKPGACADVTIFDPDREWTVDVAAFASKGKNTPLDGVKLRGRIVATIYGGRLVYKDESLNYLARRPGATPVAG